MTLNHLKTFAKEFSSRSFQLIKEEWRQYLALMICLILFFLVILTTVNQIYELRVLLAEESGTEQLRSSKAAASPTAQQPKPLSHWQLFGHERKITVPLNHTKWVLKGVILAADGKNNLAIIASNDKDEAVYQAGDTLADGALITAILFDRVLLSINGFKETVLLWDPKEKGANNEEQQAPPDGFED